MIYQRPMVQVLDTLDPFFGRLLQPCCTSAEIDWRTRQLTKFIDDNAGKIRWNLDDVCQQLSLSISGRHARRLFKLSTGIGIRDYARSRRLARAASQLRSTDTPVKVIAADAGYTSTRHFARGFKEMFHLRPGQFRAIFKRREGET